MTSVDVSVPLALLQDDRLTDADKLLWMIMRLDRKDKEIANVYRPDRLAERANLARATVYNSFKRLAEAGWFVNHDGCRKAVVNRRLEPGGWLHISVELLLCKQLLPRDIVMYGQLMGKGDGRAEGEFTYKSLGGYAHVCAKTARRAVHALQSADFLNMSQKNQMAPISYSLDSPSNKYCRKQIQLTQMRLDRPDGHGEAIALAMVTLVAAPADYYLNIRASWLENPETNELMEVDFLIPKYKLAVEFNGEQHTRPTEFASAEEVAKQKKRDALKMKFLVERGYRLVVLTAADLCVNAVVRKLKGLVPMRDLRLYGTLISFLNYVGRQYQKKAQRLQAQGA